MGKGTTAMQTRRRVLQGRDITAGRLAPLHSGSSTRPRATTRRRRRRKAERARAMMKRSLSFKAQRMKPKSQTKARRTTRAGSDDDYDPFIIKALPTTPPLHNIANPQQPLVMNDDIRSKHFVLNVFSVRLILPKKSSSLTTTRRPWASEASV